MRRLGVLVQRFGFDALIVLAYAESVLEIAAQQSKSNPPDMPVWLAAMLLALAAAPLLARRRFQFGGPAATIVAVTALSFVDGRLVTFAIGMLPWLTYNYLTLGRFTLSPAGGVGRGLFEGSWQATWSGRIQNELTSLADEIEDRAALDRRVNEVAEREQLPAGPMLEYVHQWEDIRRIWVEPVDPFERAVSRVKADEEYRRVGLDDDMQVVLVTARGRRQDDLAVEVHRRQRPHPAQDADDPSHATPPITPCDAIGPWTRSCVRQRRDNDKSLLDPRARARRRAFLRSTIGG